MYHVGLVGGALGCAAAKGGRRLRLCCAALRRSPLCACGRGSLSAFGGYDIVGSYV